MNASQRLAAWMLALCLLAAPVQGETIKYYVWTDNAGQTHMTDTPPTDRDYDTRTIEVDTTTSSPAPAARQAPSPAGGETTRRSRSTATTGDTALPRPDVDAAIAEEAQRRLDESIGADPAGADTASGADPAASGATAPAGEAATGGASASGAATAPGAALPPAIFGP